MSRDGRSTIRPTLSIRWKLIVSIILPLLIITGVVMGLTLRRIYDSAVETMQQQHMREVDLLATNPRLIQRPIITASDGTTVVGRDPESVARVIAAD